MTRSLLCTLLLLAVGCGDKDSSTDDSVSGDDSNNTDDSATDDSAANDTGTENQVSTAEGNVDLRDGTAEGLVTVAHAFSFWSENRTFVYTSANPDASCSLVTELFDPRGQDVDKNDLFLPGYCNLSFSYIGPPPLATYDIQTMTGAIVGTQCAYGEGTWEYDSSASFPDYYWTGEYYESSSWKGTFDISFLDGTEEPLLLNVALREWEGTFPYSTTRAGEYKASGNVSGVIVTEHCEGLDRTGWF